MYFYIIIAAAILTLVYVVLKIRHHKLQTSDAIFWFFFSLLLLIFALFPDFVSWLSDITQMQSSVNLILVLIIALLLYHQLAQSVELVQLRTRLADLAEHTALSSDVTGKSERINQDTSSRSSEHPRDV